MDPLTLTRLTGMTRIEVSVEDIALRLIVAFLLGVTIALTYRKTHKGFAFSYSMVVGIILISMIVSMVLMVIDNSLARAFGLVGALAIIRFRTPVKDVRDIVFLFLAVANGISTGAGAFEIAIIGVLSANFVSLGLYVSRFGGAKRARDLLIKVHVDSEVFKKCGTLFETHLEKYCESFALIEMQSGDDMPYEIIYSLQLLKDDNLQPLFVEISSAEGVTDVVLMSAVHNMDVQ